MAMTFTTTQFNNTLNARMGHGTGDPVNGDGGSLVGAKQALKNCFSDVRAALVASSLSDGLKDRIAGQVAEDLYATGERFASDFRS